MRLALDPYFLRRFLGLIIGAVAIYVVFLAGLVLIQRDLMYFPDSTVFRPEAYKLDGFTRYDYSTADGVEVHGFYAPPVHPRTLTIAFFQGNAGHLGIRAEKIRIWRKWGYGVWLPTYRGYHGNQGVPDENGLYTDARAGMAALSEHFKVARKDVVIYGESLGSGIAVQMAAEGEEAGTILEVPYTSIPDIGSARYPFVPIFWLIWDRYDSVNKIRSIHSPLMVLKAGKDEVIPSILAQRLYDKALMPKTIVTNPMAGHMGIYSSDEVVGELGAFMDALEQERAKASASP
jgi:fermentation-respiration switch protein FrsA (DUF1100 family)